MRARNAPLVPVLADDGVRLWIEGKGDERTLEVEALLPSELSGFEGEAAIAADAVRLSGPLSHLNAKEVRRRVSRLSPAPVGLQTSAGTGDRLGMATSGHAEAFRAHGRGITPVFGQQSAREMQRLGRDPRSVVDDATFGALEAAWAGAVGADADHLRSIEDIDMCVDAGFASFTLDPGDAVAESDDVDTSLSQVPWASLEDDPTSLLKRYADRTFDLEGEQLTMTEEQLRRAAGRYSGALALARSMHQHLVNRARGPIEVEFAIDETRHVTTPAEHIYLAGELRRLGVALTGFAPRYVGSFLKGVEYVGDPAELHRSLTTHARIARAFGPYKLSLHTGSDKFGIYAAVMDATRGLVHLKTSGTSYLVALELVARHQPELFRDVYATSLAAYQGSSASYPVRADLRAAPRAESVPDAALAELLHDFNTRQILHVAYAAVLRTEDNLGMSERGHRLRAVVTSAYDEYKTLLRDHIGKHLSPFARNALS